MPLHALGSMDYYVLFHIVHRVREASVRNQSHLFFSRNESANGMVRALWVETPPIHRYGTILL